MARELCRWIVVRLWLRARALHLLIMILIWLLCSVRCAWDAIQHLIDDYQHHFPTLLRFNRFSIFFVWFAGVAILILFTLLNMLFASSIQMMMFFEFTFEMRNGYNIRTASHGLFVVWDELFVILLHFFSILVFHSTLSDYWWCLHLLAGGARYILNTNGNENKKRINTRAFNNINDLAIRLCAFFLVIKQLLSNEDDLKCHTQKWEKHNTKVAVTLFCFVCLLKKLRFFMRWLSFFTVFDKPRWTMKYTNRHRAFIKVFIGCSIFVLNAKCQLFSSSHWYEFRFFFCSSMSS